METQQQTWRPRFSFRNATLIVCLLNLITALFMLQAFLSSTSARIRFSSPQPNSVELHYIKESEEIRLAMQPLELMKRVKEIEEEVHAEAEVVRQKETKQTAAVDLSKRLKDFRAINDAASTKALEEWRKRKMERARLREREKNGTASSHA